LQFAAKRRRFARVLAFGVPRLFQSEFEFLTVPATLLQWKFLKRFPAPFVGNFAKLCWIPVCRNSGLRPIAMFAAALLM
jgi:hypothetical protein